MTSTENRRDDEHLRGRPPDNVAVPVRHPGRYVAAAVILVLVAMMVHAVVFARVKRGDIYQTRFGWEVVGQFFLSGQVLQALLVTIELTVIAMAIGIFGGVLLAVMRLSLNPLVSGFAGLYVWFFRGTPVLVQLLFWFNLSWVFPELSIGIPFGPSFVTFSANSIITSFVAAFVGLGLNEAAYMSEIVRAGILSVDEGQTEAAQSLGMPRLMTLWRIVLPQAMRVIIPPTGNETIGMLKTTSLASVITVTELLYSVEIIYARTYETIPMLMVASLWYLIITTLLTIGQFYIERHFGRGTSRQQPPNLLQRLRTGLVTFHARTPPSMRALGEPLEMR